MASVHLKNNNNFCENMQKLMKFCTIWCMFFFVLCQWHMHASIKTFSLPSNTCISHWTLVHIL